MDNALCGHTFCAICVLKWAFARIHLGCGYWHEALECPLCRALLPYTADNAPRNTHTFPFIPNRIADASIKSLLTILKEAARSKTAVYVNAGVVRSRTWHGKVDGEVIPWGEGKSARVEWENRARQVPRISCSPQYALTCCIVVCVPFIQDWKARDDLARQQLDHPSAGGLHCNQGSPSKGVGPITFHHPTRTPLAHSFGDSLCRFLLQPIVMFSRPSATPSADPQASVAPSSDHQAYLVLPSLISSL